MKAKKKNGVVEHTGSTFDSFLEDEGIREELVFNGLGGSGSGGHGAEHS
jgi:hypothetical protein